MEHMLRCNALKCRKELGDRALVTTCSEDYKTSVLSGLGPNVIIECASRALSFWAYQTTQEVVYQEYLGKTLTDKYTNLSVHLDKVINEANSQIISLTNKVTSLDTDQHNLRRKNDELAQAFKEKNKKLLQTQELYDKLKRKAMMGQMQDAAEDAVDLSLYGVTGSVTGIEGGSGLGTDGQHLGIYQEPGTPFRHPHGPTNNIPRVNDMYSTQATNRSIPNTWAKTMGGAGLDVPVTPSTHRQRIGEPLSIGLSAVPGLVAGGRSPHPTMNTRAPLGHVSSNARTAGRFPAGGLSSGLKVSHGGANFDGFPKPQAVQRPAPIASMTGRREPSHQPESLIGNIRSASITGNMRSGFTSR
ncbi:cyclin B1 interacting protein-like protein 1 [Xylariales sp. AK1849]|nr:cyclin B1 interacting protein-like protein 1 [Xylariales sp. AK1849]